MLCLFTLLLRARSKGLVLDFVPHDEVGSGEVVNELRYGRGSRLGRQQVRADRYVIGSRTDRSG